MREALFIIITLGRTEGKLPLTSLPPQSLLRLFPRGRLACGGGGKGRGGKEAGLRVVVVVVAASPRQAHDGRRMIDEDHTDA